MILIGGMMRGLRDGFGNLNLFNINFKKNVLRENEEHLKELEVKNKKINLFILCKHYCYIEIPF